jgi:hypothetical protein
MERVASEADTKPMQRQVLQFVLAHKEELVAAALREELPVAAISAGLLRKFGDEIRAHRLRQFVGLCVAALLEEEGFTIVRSGVRLRSDPLFTVATFFKRTRHARTSHSAPLLQRLIDSMTNAELREAQARIKARLSQK